jgi:hypothetical protein
MHVRRRFWILLGAAVLFVLSLPVLSLLTTPHAPAPLHVEVYREPVDTSAGAVCRDCAQRLLVQLTDADGRLVDHADLRSVANMTGMDMGPLAFRPQQVGPGLYVVQLSFSMPGSWWVRLDVRTPDHQQASQTLTFWVQGAQQTPDTHAGLESTSVSYSWAG